MAQSWERDSSNLDSDFPPVLNVFHLSLPHILTASIPQINTDHFEFNITSHVLLAEVKVCVPWSMIIKLDTHFSQELHCIVIHVEVRTTF